MADFISGNEVWLIICAVLVVMAIIGYMADKERKKAKTTSRKKEEKEKNVEVVEEKKAKEAVEEKKVEPEAVVEKEISPINSQDENVPAVEEVKEEVETLTPEEEIPSQPVDTLPETFEVPSAQEEVAPSLTLEEMPTAVEEITSQAPVESTPEVHFQEPMKEIKDTTFSIPTIEESLNSNTSFYDTSMFTPMPSSNESVSSYEKEISTPTTDDIDLSGLVNSVEKDVIPSTITETGEDLTVPLGGTTIDSPFSSMSSSNGEHQDMEESLGMNDLSAFQIGDKIDQSITSNDNERNFL